MRYKIIIVLLLSISNFCSFGLSTKKYQEVFLLMGSRFEIAVISDNEEKANQGIQLAKNEIERIEEMISSWDENSETSQVNNNAGIQPTKVSDELFKLIRRSLKVSELTNGAFDISYAAIDNIWKFDGSMTVMPSETEINKSVEKINYKNILLDAPKMTVMLKEKGMKIGFGGIGKGYAANKAKAILVNNGFDNGMINAGGDLIAWGEGIDGEKWKVGIADPKKEKEIISWMEINDMAIVTSGDYEKFNIIDGERYAHIIDPRTGYPIKGIKSVTIVCPDAELADALATAVFVLGQEKGLALINKLDAIECIIVNGNDAIITSNTLNFSIK